MLGGDALTATEGPPAIPQNYKRAIVRAAPREFTVEVLPSQKIGGSHCYGVKVCPIIRAGNRTSDARSISSRASSYSEYEIWRRWEDCLDFQASLEEEYKRMSTDKIRHLKQGTHLQKKREAEGSIYNMKKAASSFDSLPEGPDYRDIVRDVHELIPELSRKASLFRVSKATLEQRQAEWSRMILGLFNPDPSTPVLLQELRNSVVTRDFFALWRRDKDYADKLEKASQCSQTIHSSPSMCTLETTYSQGSSVGGKSAAASVKEAAMKRLRHSIASHITRYSDAQSTLRMPVSAPARTPDSSNPESAGAFVFTDEFLLRPQSTATIGGFSTQMQTQVSPTRAPPVRPPRSPTTLLFHDSIPEEGAPSPPASPTRVRGRVRSNSTTSTTQYHCPWRQSDMAPSPGLPHEYYLEPGSPTRPEYAGSPPPTPGPTQLRHPLSFYSTSSRGSDDTATISNFSMAGESFVTANTSVDRQSKRYSTYTFNDGDSIFELADEITKSIPVPPTHFDPIGKNWRRESAASFATFRTEQSADGVLPSHLRQQYNIPLADAPQHNRVLHDEEEGNYYAYDDGDNAIRFSMTEFADDLPPLEKDRPNRNSILSVSSDDSTSTINETRIMQSSLAVKALYLDHVIVFRADRDMTLAGIRQRLKERFEQHEGLPLKDRFILGYLPPRPSNGVGKCESQATDRSRLRRLQFQSDWDTAMSLSNGKVTIRILDPEPFSTYI